MFFGDAIVIVPKYSYTDYLAFKEGVPFEPNGIAKNPYFSISDEENKIEYIEDLSVLRMSGVTVKKQEGKEYIGFLKHCFTYGVLDLPFYRSNLSYPIVLCYPSLGADNVENLRSLVNTSIVKPDENVKVAVLGELNPELKGDVNLDGVVDISDVTATLEYLARRTAGLEASFKYDEELNKFSYYLADTDTESTNGADSKHARIDISDATNILTYYAQSLAVLEPDWETIVSGNGIF